MNIKIDKFIGLTLIVVVFGVLLAGCTTEPPVEEERVILTVGIEVEEGGIVEVEGEPAEAGEEFMFAKGSEVTLEAEPEEGYEFVGWDIGDMTSPDLEIAINVYEDITVQANFVDAEKEFKVEYENPRQGVITARYDDESVFSGDMVEAGADVEFEVIILEEPRGYEVDNWLVNEEELAEEDELIYVHENLGEDIEVTVELKETAFFAVEIEGLTYRIDEAEEKVEITVDYVVINEGLVEDTQDIEFEVDGDIQDEEEVTLEAGDKYGEEDEEGQFELVIDKYDEDEYELAVISEDDRDEIKVKIEYVTGELKVDVIWELPPSAPEDVEAHVIKVVEEKGILIEWSEVNEAEEYNVVRQQPELADEGEWRVVGTAPAQEAFYIDDEVEAGRVYRYAVVAVNENDKTSDYSKPTEEVSF